MHSEFPLGDRRRAIQAQKRQNDRATQSAPRLRNGDNVHFPHSSDSHDAQMQIRYAVFSR